MQTSDETKVMSPADTAMKRVTGQIGEHMPEGFGGDQYWKMTVETHDAFVDAVALCRERDTQVNRDAVRQTGAAWRRAWAGAYEAFRKDHKEA